LVALKNDTINALYGDDCYVKLEYNSSSNHLTVSLKFNSFVFDFDEKGTLRNCPCPLFERYCAYEIVNIKNGFIGPPLMSDSTVYARVREGPEKGTLYEFYNEWIAIGNQVKEYSA